MNLLSFLKDPLGINTASNNLDRYYKSLKKEIHSIKQESSKSFEEIINDYRQYAKEQEKKADFYSMSLQNIGEVLPDMIWMKWLDGKYAYANKAIRDGLLFNNDPIGMTDVELGAAAVNRFGGEMHNFGAYCAGSDAITIEYGHRKRFIEYGMSGCVPLVLEVFKNVVRKDGDIIGTVGTGRDITELVFTMFRISEDDKCENSKCDLYSSSKQRIGIVNSYLESYLYDNEEVDNTLFDFYIKHKDMYERAH